MQEGENRILGKLGGFGSGVCFCGWVGGRCGSEGLGRAGWLGIEGRMMGYWNGLLQCIHSLHSHYEDEVTLPLPVSEPL
jgi:hypothetical protein